MIATVRQCNVAYRWCAGLIAMVGTWMLRIALPMYISQLTGSTRATGTMVIATLLMTLTLLPLLTVASASDWCAVYLVACVESTIDQFVEPAENALLPGLVDEAHVIAANSLNALNNTLAHLIGPALGGIVAALLGRNGVALLDAAGALGMITSLLALLDTTRAGLLADPIGGVTLLKVQGSVCIITGLAALTVVSQCQDVDELQAHA